MSVAELIVHVKTHCLRERKRLFLAILWLHLKSPFFGTEAKQAREIAVVSSFFQKNLSVVQSAFHKASFPLSELEW